MKYQEVQHWIDVQKDSGKIRKVNDAMFMSKKKNCAFL